MNRGWKHWPVTGDAQTWAQGRGDIRRSFLSQFKKPMTLHGRKCAKESYFPAYNDFFFLLKTKHNLNFKSVLRFKIMPLKTAL